MKQRIISGAMIGAALVSIVTLGCFFSITYSVAMAIIGAVCIFELFNNTGFVKSNALMVAGAIFAVISPFVNQYTLDFDYSYLLFLYVVVVCIIALIEHKKTNPTNLAYAIAMPMLVVFALRSIVLMAIESLTGLFYLLLLFCYTVLADIGAYFIGVLFGSHKMAPTISPKKTYEGLIGGIGAGVIGVLAVCLIFKTAFAYPSMKIVLTVLTTPLFVILGVFGDLVASYLKRFAQIKDFGDTIPGHGGITDRIDSMLLVAPVFYIFNEIFNLAGM